MAVPGALTSTPIATGADYIESLRGRYKTALLSNAMRPFLRQVLDKYDLPRLFDVLVISYEVGLTKPNPAIFQLTAQRLGVPASACFFIDDSQINIDAARVVGMKAARFTGVEQLKRDLAAL